MKAQAPTTTTQSQLNTNQALLNSLLMPRANIELNLIRPASVAGLEVIPQGPFADFVIPVNGRIHEVENALISDSIAPARSWVVSPHAVNINLAQQIGGVIDGTVLAADQRYLVWALFDDSNTTFLGFCLTAKPWITGGTVSSGGALGSYLALTGYAGTLLNQCQRFTPGQTVLVFNDATGSAPNYVWNTGRVSSIVSNTAITIALDNNSVNGSSTISGSAVQVRAWDKFRCFNNSSSTDTDERYYHNARLIGEFQVRTSNIGPFRSLFQPVSHLGFNTQLYAGGATSTVLGTGASVTLHMLRNVPPWATLVGCSTACNPGTFTEHQLNVIQTPSTTSVTVRADRHNTASANQIYPWECAILEDFQISTAGVPRAGSGTLTLGEVRYRWGVDGGLRE